MRHKRKLGNQKAEECGIWLDTAELKRRKMGPRSILKLLSPLSRSKYNIEAALNFTQTRAPQRCAKQTTVPSFFSPKSKGKLVNPPPTPTPGAVSAASPVSGKNVTEGETCTNQPELIREEDFRSDGSGRGALVDQQERWPTTSREVRCSSEESDPPHGSIALALNEQRYRPSEQGQQCPRKDGAGVDTAAHELLPACSITAGEASTSSDAPTGQPDRLTQLDFTQDSQGNRVTSHGKPTSSPAMNHAPDKGTPVAEGKADGCPWAESEILCTESFEAALCRPLTSTQRTISREGGLSERKSVRSPKKLNSDWGKDSFPENKENACGPTVLLSTRKEMNLNPTSLKRPLQPAGTTSLLHRSNVPHSAGSLAAKRSKKPRDGQRRWPLLFSQDSQGSRVISHRRTDRSFPEKSNLPSSCCTNAISRGNSCSAPPNVKLPLLCKSSCLVESQCDNTFSPQADLLFTQDSEGNAVIKHC